MYANPHLSSHSMVRAFLPLFIFAENQIDFFRSAG
jgi:hypothetical protein